ncbi:MAG: hypothetical protein RIG68_16050 [Imperialibacter sp.]|uniref:hypothetical protein n=1 Tax=Imperialibacter sp. TaxID=2038411 RepID=UPI0032EC0116
MEIVEVTAQEYNAMVSAAHVFSTVGFNTLNADKVDAVKFLVFKDSKVRMGLILGIKGATAKSPFSAPFGGFSMAGSPSLEQLDEATDALKSWITGNLLTELVITPPPLLYDPSVLSKVTNVLYRKGFVQKNMDLNYALDLETELPYASLLRKNARKNLNNALANNLVLKVCATAEEKEAAYQVIAANRAAKGYPLRMTWQQMLSTTKIIEADFFLVTKEDVTVAAAIVFAVTDDIMQVIYWGDMVEYSHMRPVNFLACQLFEHYRNAGKKVLDIGPSTEDSLPNYGLCDFKESIGCEVSIKPSYIWSV